MNRPRWALISFLIISVISKPDPTKTKRSVAVLDVKGVEGVTEKPVTCNFELPPTEKTSFLFELADPLDGCGEIARSSTNSNGMMIERGTCTFITKACNAQKAGAEFVLVLNNQKDFVSIGGDESEFKNMDCEPVPTCIIDLETSQLFKEQKVVPIHIERLENSVFDPALMICWAWATALTGFAAIYAVSNNFLPKEQRFGVATAKNPENEMTVGSAFVFVGMASTMLVVLYFFINYLVYGLIFVYAMGAESSFVDFFFPYFKKCFGSSDRRVEFPFLGIRQKASYLTLHAISTVLVLWWWFTRKGTYAFIFQDLFGALLCIRMQMAINLPNLKIGTILLSLFFLYDIFFVFISPYIFGGNVMVTVGTGGNTGETMPMVFVFPKVWAKFSPHSMLGLGDVAFPCFLLTFLRRFDVERKLEGMGGYFWPALIGYGLGMGLTEFILIVFQAAQPALLYLVPFTVGPTILLAKTRGHFQDIWLYKGGSAAYKRVPQTTKGETEEDADFITKPRK